MSFNLATMLRESALAHPDKAVSISPQLTMSYAELDDRSGRLAAGLAAAGLSRGATVAVQLPNVPEFLVAYFGILKAGMVMVPLNPLLTAPEIAHQLDDSQARLVITSEAGLPAAAAAAGELPVYVVGPGAARPFSELCVGPEADIEPTAAEDPAVIIYTSGTTGKPKGAELSHFQLYMNCTVAGSLFGVRDEDVTLASVPMFHVYGLSGMLNVAVRYGTTLVLLPRFAAEPALEAIERHRISVLVGVPTMYHALVEADDGSRDLSSLRVASSGGAALPEALLNRIEERFGIVVLEGYGMTETASTATLNRMGDRRPLSVGKPIWGVEARVVDAGGLPLPPGQGAVGELVLRGHNITKGYHRDPAATALAIRDGWLHTGDLAHQDGDGFLFVVDRIKDLIIRGGYNVYPREVEEVLHAHPAVGEAAVVGRPDQRLGEEVVAVVCLRDGAAATPEEIIGFCRTRLAAYKYPREVRIMAALPKNASGKLLKRELRG